MKEDKKRQIMKRVKKVRQMMKGDDKVKAHG